MCTTCLQLRPWQDDCSFSGLTTQRSLRTETADAAAGTATTYTLVPGDYLDGRYGSATDSDWFRIRLEAGETYIFTLDGKNPVDALLSLRDARGTVLAEDDDGAGAGDSRIVITIDTTGTYYLDVSQFAMDRGSGVAGDYTLSVRQTAATGTVWTADQMAEQLTDGYWMSRDQSTRAFDVPAGGTITVNLSALSPAMRLLAEAALQAWSETTGLHFAESRTAAMIDFVTTSTSRDAEAYTESTLTVDGTIVSSSVVIDQDWIDTYGDTLLSYSFQTYIHEIGHALGLGHAGNYNGGAVYPTDAQASNDSWQLTVMSYFSQQQNSTLKASYAYAVTPMLADLLAITDLYGATPALRTGNTTYGERSTAGAPYDLFSATNTDADKTTTLTMTLVDGGGIDTLNFRSDRANQRIDLRPETASDVYGDLGTLVIARGTIIENVLAGSGHDQLTGNDQTNSIDGGGGNDSLYGLSGNDWLTPGAGEDLVDGGTGVDMVSFVDARSGAVIDLGRGTAVIAGETDRLSGVENLTATIFADMITGDAGANRIRALGDYDWMVGSGGRDIYEGGTGRDTVAYSNAAAGVTASLSSGTGTAGQASGDRYTEVENLTGGSFGDRLTGNTDRNILRGLGGDDFLFGLAGNDTLDGGAGRDHLNGGLGTDRITGGRGNDTIDGGGGWDTAIFTGRRAQYSVTENTDGSTSVLHKSGGTDGIDLLVNIDVLEFSDGRLFL